MCALSKRLEDRISSDITFFSLAPLSSTASLHYQALVRATMPGLTLSWTVSSRFEGENKLFRLL